MRQTRNTKENVFPHVEAWGVQLHSTLFFLLLASVRGTDMLLVYVFSL